MAFPIIQFKAVNTVLEGTYQDLVEHKFASLERYMGQATDLKCEVEFEKISAKNNGPIFRVEANFYRDGTLFRADATEESFEKAIDRVRNELDKEMRRTLSKRGTLLRRGSQAIKDMMRFGR